MEPAKVMMVEYYGKQIADRHHTSEYDLLRTNNKTAVYRRGYNFYIAVGLERDFNLSNDVVKIGFEFGLEPITYVTLLLDTSRSLPKDPYQWAIALDRIDPNYLLLEIHIPPNAPVGIWSCNVLTYTRESPENVHRYQVPEDFYVLFNPWCKEDDVYMEGKDEKTEYLLNDFGVIWLGTWWRPEGRHWLLAQFSEIALEVAVALLDKSGLVQRGDATLVARAISGMINSDNGLLVPIPDEGVTADTWTGCKAIMEQYNNSGRVPAKSWVTSAVTATVCRALGIPCRSTTVYNSAEGTDNIIRKFDRLGNLVFDEGLRSYHVWNEVWMARPGLPEGFSGWQVIDATPRRVSGVEDRCGPAPVAAIRQSNTGHLYDIDTIITRLNASIQHLIVDDDESRPTRSNNSQSGKRIVTKSLGPSSNTWEDITSSYKPQRETRSTDDDNDVAFDLVMNPVSLGDAVSFTVTLDNRSGDSKEIWYVLTATTGKVEIGTLRNTVTVEPRHSGSITLSIPASKYLTKLVDDGFIKFTAICEVKDATKQRWVGDDYFTFPKPALTISTKRFCRVGATIDVSVSFRNPLNVALTDCVYMIEGPGDRSLKSISSPDVPALEETKLPASVKAGMKAGEKRIVVSFTSKQLHQISDSVVIHVQNVDVR